MAKFIGAAVLHGISLYFMLTYASELGYDEAAREALRDLRLYVKKEPMGDGIVLDEKTCCNDKKEEEEDEDVKITVVKKPIIEIK